MYAKNSPINKTISPWAEEELRLLRLERQQRLLPRCVCCGLPVVSERYLDLEGFGIRGVGCERCVDKALEYNE